MVQLTKFNFTLPHLVLHVMSIESYFTGIIFIALYVQQRTLWIMKYEMTLY